MSEAFDVMVWLTATSSENSSGASIVLHCSQRGGGVSGATIDFDRNGVTPGPKIPRPLCHHNFTSQRRRRSICSLILLLSVLTWLSGESVRRSTRYKFCLSRFSRSPENQGALVLLHIISHHIPTSFSPSHPISPSFPIRPSYVNVLSSPSHQLILRLALLPFFWKTTGFWDRGSCTSNWSLQLANSYRLSVVKGRRRSEWFKGPSFLHHTSSQETFINSPISLSAGPYPTTHQSFTPYILFATAHSSKYTLPTLSLTFNKKSPWKWVHKVREIWNIISQKLLRSHLERNWCWFFSSICRER